MAYISTRSTLSKLSLHDMEHLDEGLSQLPEFHKVFPEMKMVYLGNGEMLSYRTDRDKIEMTGLAVDIAVALAILFAGWFMCEWWIRRRAARKGT